MSDKKVAVPAESGRETGTEESDDAGLEDVPFSVVRFSTKIRGEFLQVMKEVTTLGEAELDELLRRQYEESMKDCTMLTAFRRCCMFPLWPPKDAEVLEKTATPVGKYVRSGDEIVVLLYENKKVVKVLFVGQMSIVDDAIRRWQKRRGADSPKEALAYVKSRRKQEQISDPYTDEIDDDWMM